MTIFYKNVIQICIAYVHPNLAFANAEETIRILTESQTNREGLKDLTKR